MARTLPLELALEYAVPTEIPSLAATSTSLREASKSKLYWTALFRRRFPGLAALPRFDSPSDPRGLVKALLRATPPPPVPQRRGRSSTTLFPAPPRDEQGRATPLPSDCIVVAQLSLRGSSAAGHQPMIYGSGRVQYTSSSEVLGFALPLIQASDDTKDVVREKLGLAREVDSGQTDSIAEMMVQSNHEFDNNFVQEFFIAANDTIWKLNHECLTKKATMVNQGFMDFVLGTEHPWLPVFVGASDISLGMKSQWLLGSYSDLDAMSFKMSFKMRNNHIIPHLQINSRAEMNDYFAPVPDPDDPHTHLCQILAAAIPVRFPRASS